MISFPFDSQITSYTEEGYPIYDRAVDSTAFRKLFKNTFSNGIYSSLTTCLQVVENTGMKVTVKAGACLIEGAIGYEQLDRTMSVEASDSQDRIDRVVARLNDNKESRKIELYILKGTPSENPQPVALTRNESVYDICLATLYINANSQEIKQTKITDTRLDSEVCGVVTVLTKVDTTDIFNQYNDAMQDIIDGYNSAIEGTLAGQLQSDIKALKTVKEVTLGTTWSGNSQTVALDEITANDNPSLDVKLDGTNDTLHEEEWAKVIKAVTSDGNITFYLRNETDPTTTEITVLVKGV